MNLSVYMQTRHNPECPACLFKVPQQIFSARPDLKAAYLAIEAADFKHLRGRIKDMLPSNQFKVGPHLSEYR